MPRFRFAVLLVLLVALPAAAADPARDLLCAGRIDDAIAALQTRIQASPQDAEAHHLLSRAYLLVEKWEAAVEAAEKAAAFQPKNSDYHMWLGRAYGNKAEHCNPFCAAGLARKVRAEFERAVELNPANVRARSDLAEYYMEAPGVMGGSKDKARQQADQIQPRDPAAAHWVRARLAEKEKQYDVAEKEYLAAVEASNDPSEAWLDLASFYRRRGRWTDLESAVGKAVGTPKRTPATLFQAASLLFRAGRNFPSAVEMLRQYLNSEKPACEAPPFRAQYLLGSILEKQGEKQAAAAAYQAALAVARNFDDPRKALKRVGK
ncbi:MAG: tetratricopeptide repeat protein [Acidobacteria bacterium]|nr:tetratricopeptide repeat protein [Acidobacteriota bacterium]